LAYDGRLSSQIIWLKDTTSLMRDMELNVHINS